MESDSDFCFEEPFLLFRQCHSDEFIVSKLNSIVKEGNLDLEMGIDTIP